MLKQLYLSPLGYFASLMMNLAAVAHRPFMVYGYYNRVTGSFHRRTRISSTAALIARRNLDIADNVWVWHHSILDASNGLTIGQGCQIGAWVGIFTHSSHVAIRLLGDRFLHIDRDQRAGYQRGPVAIGEFTFIGASSLVLPGVTIGRGCLIAAGSVVSRSVPDGSIAAGNPARVVGRTAALDGRHLADPEVQRTYYDQSAAGRFRTAAGDTGRGGAGEGR